MKTILILIALFTISFTAAQNNEKDQIYRTEIMSGDDAYYVYEVDESLFLSKVNVGTKKEEVLPIFPLHLYYQFIALKGEGKEIAPIKDRRGGISNPKMFDKYMELKVTKLSTPISLAKKLN